MDTTIIGSGNNTMKSWVDEKSTRCCSMGVCVNDCHNRGFVCPFTAHTASEAAKERVGESFIQEKRKVSVHAGDLRHVRHLGKGGFCEVSQMELNNETIAVKKLRQTIMLAGPDECIMGAVDLAGEAAIMTKLNHENIVKIHGMSSGSIRENLTSDNGMFVVMECLEKTLDRQLQEWKKNVQKPKMMTGRNKKLNTLLERLSSGLQIAKALQYLHQQDIVHRDLKPGNIGIDMDGTVKLFDFGLAQKHKQGDMPLMEYCGTIRYMAPEIALYRGYGREVDVYALGLILWQICEVDRPFRSLDTKEMQSKVAEKGERPQTRRWWPNELKDLLKQCWDASPSKRPTMDQVVMILEKILARRS